ncbi:unnamed protein product [Arctia plantaginis]|uniref:Uncharacterized protein n=1 Tax=Arctia plantaginis TaxID=874455 RepID=A0A8S0ZUX8_ARCPL|nr:unnamed protein product [Arctia plantaginis]
MSKDINGHVIVTLGIPARGGVEAALSRGAGGRHSRATCCLRHSSRLEPRPRMFAAHTQTSSDVLLDNDQQDDNDVWCQRK